MKTFTMTIKKEWFDKIKAGVKTVEYREAKPYWQKRLLGKNIERIVFKNGYSRKAPELTCKVKSITYEDGIKTDLKYNGVVFAIAIELEEPKP